jgi:hypothetical protein
MKLVCASVFAMMLWTGASAQAGACADLMNSARSALSMEGLDETTRSQLEELLRAAQSGDPSQCEKATGSIFQSSPEGEKAPTVYRCKDSEKTV